MSQKYKMLIKVREKIKPDFRWVDWQPAGYTDDLGIIADRNQWVKEVIGGYYSVIDAQDYLPMREWCEQNFKYGDWRTDFAGGLVYIILQNEKDVAWFMLRWS